MLIFFFTSHMVSRLKIFVLRVFPGGPVVKILHFHCMECGFDLWSGNNILSAVVVQGGRGGAGGTKQNFMLAFYLRLVTMLAP